MINGISQIEIVQVDIIDGGVQVFARAWDLDDNQIGFGVDGSVDIERFQYFNPPVLIPDKNGSIAVTSENTEVGEPHSYNLSEDPEAAVNQMLQQTILQVGKASGNIVEGKIGRTTSTFYPSVTALDGWIRNEKSSTTWAVVHDGTTGSLATTDNSNDLFVRNQNTSGTYFDLIRVAVFFDTSALPDADTISAATLSLYVISKTNTDDDGTDYVSIVESTVSSDTALATTDFDLLGAPTDPTEAVATGDRLDISSVTVSAYNDWDFNATGIAMISKTGISKFAVREGHDIENETPAITTNNELQIQNSEFAGSTQDPKLVVTHSSTTNTTLTASVGAFTLTGIATAFSLASNIVASVGTFTLTGIAVVFATGKGMVADTGVFILTGLDALFSAPRSIVASAGSFTLTGISATLTWIHRLVAETGAFVLTGINTLLKSSVTWFNTSSKTVSDWFNQGSK